VLLLSKPNESAGVTLLELLVTLVILSILASVALPYAELTIRRNKELELRQALRDIRTAIDEFHHDWKDGKISRSNTYASEDGYPVTLDVLVNGVDNGKADGKKRYYLRNIPRDPFTSDADVTGTETWSLRGYQDPPDRLNWNGKDVYDVHSSSHTTAIDGTYYREW
jgi:general secretion pathway protein G